MKYKYVLFPIILLISTTSCDKWPPFDGDAHDYFEAHKQGIFELKNEMKKTGFIEITNAGLSGPIRFRHSFEQLIYIGHP